MTLRQVLWFIAAYIVIVALAIWFNLAVLCQGDVKFNRGCGGFALYIPLWELFLAPLPVAAILLELWRKATLACLIRWKVVSRPAVAYDAATK